MNRVTGRPGAGAEPAGPALGEVLSRFSADPQVTWWVRWALLAAGAGVAVTLLASWRPGVTAGIAVMIAGAIVRARMAPLDAGQAAGACSVTRRPS